MANRFVYNPQCGSVLETESGKPVVYSSDTITAVECFDQVINHDPFLNFTEAELSSQDEWVATIRDHEIGPFMNRHLSHPDSNMGTASVPPWKNTTVLLRLSKLIDSDPYLILDILSQNLTTYHHDAVDAVLKLWIRSLCFTTPLLTHPTQPRTPVWKQVRNTLERLRCSLNMKLEHNPKMFQISDLYSRIFAIENGIVEIKRIRDAMVDVASTGLWDAVVNAVRAERESPTAGDDDEYVQALVNLCVAVGEFDICDNPAKAERMRRLYNTPRPGEEDVCEVVLQRMDAVLVNNKVSKKPAPL